MFFWWCCSDRNHDQQLYNFFSLLSLFEWVNTKIPALKTYTNEGKLNLIETEIKLSDDTNVNCVVNGLGPVDGNFKKNAVITPVNKYEIFLRLYNWPAIGRCGLIFYNSSSDT